MKSFVKILLKANGLPDDWQSILNPMCSSWTELSWSLLEWTVQCL